jgi:hypothetical protein
MDTVAEMRAAFFPRQGDNLFGDEERGRTLLGNTSDTVTSLMVANDQLAALNANIEAMRRDIQDLSNVI